MGRSLEILMNRQFDNLTSGFWAIGQVVKLKYGCEHTSEALEIWAFYVLGCVHDARVQGVFSCVHGS